MYWETFGCFFGGSFGECGCRGFDEIRQVKNTTKVILYGSENE